jgi:predicted transcriptional regulator
MKRQTYDVAAEILFLAMSGVKKTKILYSCNLSFTMCDKYIRLLLGNGFLEKKLIHSIQLKRVLNILQHIKKLSTSGTQPENKEY